MGKLRGVGDVLKTDPHKRMLKRSKRLAKKMHSIDTEPDSIKSGVDKKETIIGGDIKLEPPKKKKGTFDYGGRMFTADAWAPD